LANALEYAHEEKIVHRDLKPGNIMISRTGRLKLADFGIAASVADSLSRSSMQGFVSGTTLYMSPQQMEGAAPKETDDVYAFGATIYELLTSRPPFYTGNVEHQVLQVTPTPPSQRLGEFGFVGQIPPHVQELVMACLAKVPEGRPQSMGAIRDWIQSDGKAEGAIPKPSTKTIKHAAPVAAGGEPAGVAQESGSSGWSTYVVAVVFILICFIVGKNCSGGKEESSAGDNNGSAAIIPASLEEGLVAYYLFNGNAKDESGNGHHGTVTGVTQTNDRHGAIDSAYSFYEEIDSLGSYISLPNETMKGGSKISISVWISTEAGAKQGSYSRIVGGEAGGSVNVWLGFAENNSNLLMLQVDTPTQNKLLGQSVIEKGRWVHIALVFDGHELAEYVNGSKGAFRSATGDYPPMRGIYVGGSKHFTFRGKIDDVRIYNRALSEAEVKALYDFEKADSS